MKVNIYIVRNTVNNKVYIGQTKGTIENRMKKHIWDAKTPCKKNPPFHDAIMEYGADKFFAEKIEECDEKIGDEREKYWIRFYNSDKDGGYNVTLGGRAFMPYRYEEIEELLKNGYGTREIMNKIGCCKQMVYKIANIAGIEIPKSHQEKKIRQLTQDGEEIAEFASIGAAIRYLKRKDGLKTKEQTIRKNISRCCNDDTRNYAYGYRWEFTV